MFESKFIDQEIEYTGLQLAPHWIYNNFNLKKDALVSFIGPCNVGINELVDLEDVKNNAHIYSPKMLHFIGEFFEDNQNLMVMRQRLFIVILKEELEERAVPGRLLRKGDDIYHFGIGSVKRKLSVSIATKSTTSTLLHVGLNIHTQGTPVPAAGLNELGVEPVNFATKTMEKLDKELDDIDFARCKVRGV